MANDAVIEGVEIKDFLPGTPLGAAGLESLGRAANEYLRTGGIGTVGELYAKAVPDAFVGGLAQHNGVSTSLWPAGLCVPVVTTAHNQLRVRVRATIAGVGNSFANFATVLGGDTLALGGAPAAIADYEGLIDIDTSGDYDEVTANLATAAGSTITIHGIWVWYEPLATPIAAGTDFSGAQAFGIVSMGADKVYDAMKTDALVTLAEHVRDRPRVLWTWVAISAGVNGDGLMLDRPHRAWATLHRGALAAGVTYRIRINVTGAPGTVYLQAGRRTDPPNNDIPIAAAANGWLDTTFELPNINAVGSIPFPSTSLGIYPWDGAIANTGRTTVDVLSLTIWGP